MTEVQIDEFEKCEAQLAGLHEEIGILSKKRPDGAVNKWKLKFVNRILEKADGILEERYRPFEGFGAFEVIGVPTNSDVVMMLAQYIRCMDKMRGDNVYVNVGRWFWYVDGMGSNLLTSGPRRLKGK
jgi:hypothetical protein